MPTTLIDTAGWQVVVPVKLALNLAGSHLTATLADRFGGAVVTLDSTVPVPGYEGAYQIDWTADPVTSLSDHLVLTVTRAMRGGWLAAGPNGLPGLVTLFADVKRTVAGSARDPEPLGRTSLAVAPGTDSPAVAAAGGGFQAVLVPIQGLQTVTATALQIGPQGPPGEQGPPGAPAGGAGAGQTFTQATPAATWTIPHGYGRRPIVAVYDATGAELLADVAADTATVTVTFAQPTAGSAVLV